MSLGSQVKKYRIKFGMTLEQLEEASGVNIGTIGAIESRGSNRSQYAVSLAKGLGLTLEQLLDETKDYDRGDQDKLDNNIFPPSIQSNFVPLVSWVNAGNWETPLDDRDKYDMVQCPIKECSAKTFALRVRGISMDDPNNPKSFQDGDLIFVDPERDAHNGSLVIVMHDENYDATFKQLIIEDGRQFLKALNPAWTPQIQEIKQDAYVCGVVIARIKATTYI